MSATGSTAGFSLIECLAVLAITAMASLIAFPSLEHAASAVELVQSRQALLANLEQARGAALERGAPQTLTLAADFSAYGWNGQLTRRLPAGVQLREEALSAIGFYPDGSASPGRLTLAVGDRRAAIVVTPIGVIEAETSRAQP